MNERITLLALKASDPKTGWLDRQKFAELIVRECANTIQAEKDTGLYNAQQMAGMTASKAVINDHFGVEE